VGAQLDLSESRDIIGHVTTRSPIGHFLMVVLLNQGTNQLLIYDFL